jgi:hypothetical protein
LKTLQSLFEGTVSDLQRVFAAQVFERKLREVGVEPSKELIEILTDHVLGGGGDEIELDHPDWPEDLVIMITDSDLEQLDRETTRFLKEDLPGVVREHLLSSARGLRRTLKRKWPAQHSWEQETHSAFQRRLEKRWSRGLTGLRMLLTISREIGGERYQRYARSRAKTNRARDYVLLWLHARGCQVTAEILVLLENGYADGAMARWRTLHEISVVATLIADHGDELAERYLAHESVEANAILKVRLETFKELGYKPPSKREIAHAERVHLAALAQFGPEFGRTHGWAAKHVKPCNSFADLARAAGRSKLRSHYKLASHNVHAGIKGITHKLGAMGQRIIVAGASNAGLHEPGQNAAITLCLITLPLLATDKKADRAVHLKLLDDLCKETMRGFIRASRQLNSEEKARKRDS